MLDPGRLDALRRTLVRSEPHGGGRGADRRVLGFGIASLDRALGGGLSLGALHEIAPAAPADIGSAGGFALTLAARAGRDRHVVWIQQDAAVFEAGSLYGPGLDLFGLAMARLVVLRVARARDALWAMEEALKSGAVAGVVAELAQEGAGDLTATRRLALAAAEGAALGLLLRHRSSPCACAAPTRWNVAAASSPRDAFGGLGPTSFALTLVKNRHGPTGRWLVTWNHHERIFAATLSGGVAAAAGDRPDRTPPLARIA